MKLKALIKKGLVSLATSRLIEKLFAQQRNIHIPVFMLHRFDDPERGVEGHSIAFLYKALTWLKENNYQVVSIDKLVDALDGVCKLPDRAVVFTIDDGFIEQVDIAAKVFEEFDYPLSIFLISDFSSRKSWPWDYQVEYILNQASTENIVFNVADKSINIDITARIGSDSRKDAITNTQNLLKCLATDEAIKYTQSLASLASVELKNDIPESYSPATWVDARMAESNNVRFGPHSTRHAILMRQSMKASQQEIAGSKEALERELENPINIFCYPTGRKNIDFGRREMDIVKELGMRAALSVTPGYVNLREHGKDEHRFCLPRFGFPDNLEDFIQIVSWIELFKEKLRGNL